MQGLIRAYQRIGLVPLIIIGLILGVLFGSVMPDSVIKFTNVFGTLFVGALKAIAPLLVFVLVIASLAQHQRGVQVNVRPTLMLYIAGTFLAALTAVVASMLFPTTLTLVSHEVTQAPPSSLAEVLTTLLSNMLSLIHI